MKVCFETLGCKLNQAETEELARQFVAAGCRVVPAEDKADIYILNTCTVTSLADAKSRHWLRMAHRLNPDAVVVATGCYVQRAAEELTQIEGVDLVVSNDDKPHLAELLQKSGIKLSIRAPVAGHNAGFRTRSFIKIQDGCSRYCAYCIVPLVRGQEKSVPAEEILKAVRNRVAEGCQEIVLTGTEVGSYQDGSIGLKELLDNILSRTDIARLRLSSLQPQEITAELLELWRDIRLTPHFHLSLQCGSDSVLQQMKRRYSVNGYRQAVSRIRSVVPDAAITTDIIVGFPGETDAEFMESLEACRELGFARIHVFQYSPRPGTAATSMPGQVSASVKKECSRQMLALAQESAKSFRQQFLGRTLDVLWEQRTASGLWAGLTANYIRVYTGCDEDLSNRILPAKLVKPFKDGIWGENG